MDAAAQHRRAYRPYAVSQQTKPLCAVSRAQVAIPLGDRFDLKTFSDFLPRPGLLRPDPLADAVERDFLKQK